CGGGDRDIHAAQLVDRVVLDFGEYNLLAYAQRVVATAVEGARRHTAEVANTRHGDADQAVKELVHASAAQRDLAADRQPLAQLEGGNRLLGLAHQRLLAGDLGQVGDRGVHQLAVGHGLA